MGQANAVGPTSIEGSFSRYYLLVCPNPNQTVPKYFTRSCCDKLNVWHDLQFRHCFAITSETDNERILAIGHHLAMLRSRSPAVAEGPRDVGVPVEILAAVERLYYTPNEYRSRVCVSLTAYVKVHSHRRN